jgi:hypothetical protein
MDMQKMAGLVSSSRKAKPYLQQMEQQQSAGMWCRNVQH